MELMYRTCIELIHKHELKTKKKMHQRIKKRNTKLYSNKSNQPKLAIKVLQGIDDIVGKNMTRQNMYGFKNQNDTNTMNLYQLKQKERLKIKKTTESTNTKTELKCQSTQNIF